MRGLNPTLFWVWGATFSEVKEGTGIGMQGRAGGGEGKGTGKRVTLGRRAWGREGEGRGARGRGEKGGRRWMKNRERRKREGMSKGGITLRVLPPSVSGRA